MTNEQYAILVREISKPEYSQLTPEEITSALHALTGRMPDHSFKTMRAVMLAVLGAGLDFDSLYGRLQAAAQASPTVKQALLALETYSDGGGLDFADPTVLAMLDGLVSQNVLTQQEADAIKSLQWRAVPKYEELGLPPVAVGNVESALAMMR